MLEVTAATADRPFLAWQCFVTDRRVRMGAVGACYSGSFSEGRDSNKLLFPKRRRSPHYPPRSPDLPVDLPVATSDTMPDLSSLRLPPDLVPLDLLYIKTVVQLRPELANLQNPSC